MSQQPLPYYVPQGQHPPGGQPAYPPGGYPPGQQYPPPGQQYPPPGQQYPPPGQQYPPPGQQYPPPGQQYPPPGQQYPPPGQYPPGQQPVIVQPGQQPTTVVVMGPTCGQCGRGPVSEKFTTCGIILAICFFPFGIICCLMMKKKKCSSCGTNPLPAVNRPIPQEDIHHKDDSIRQLGIIVKACDLLSEG